MKKLQAGSVLLAEECYSDSESHFNPQVSPPRMCGIGVLFHQDQTTGEKRIFVAQTAPGGPAERTGRVRQGDLLVSIDSMDVYGQDLEYVSKYILGPEGSVVRLGLCRRATISNSISQEVDEVTINRGIVESVPVLLLANGGHRGPKSSNSISPSSLLKEAEKMPEKSSTSSAAGVIIDWMFPLRLCDCERVPKPSRSSEGVLLIKGKDERTRQEQGPAGRLAGRLDITQRDRRGMNLDRVSSWSAEPPAPIRTPRMPRGIEAAYWS